MRSWGRWTSGTTLSSVRSRSRPPDRAGEDLSSRRRGRDEGVIMGAWGRGLLQNDETQDALLRVVREISEDVGRLRRRRPAPDVAGRVAAAVGLMLQLQLWP